MNVIELDEEALKAITQDATALSAEGRHALEQWCGDVWTDHNTADPGITLLEVLSLAISDLGYRLGFPIADLMTRSSTDPDKNHQAYHPDHAILPSNIVTESDIRTAVMALPGVRNAMLLSADELSTDAHIQCAMTAGGINLLVDLEDAWAIKPDADKRALAYRIRERFVALRNVGQDLNCVSFVQKHGFALKMRLTLASGTQPVKCITEILKRIIQSVSEEPTTYGYEKSENHGLSHVQAYDGPPNFGFMLPEELEQSGFAQWLYISNILESINNTVGLEAVPGIQFWPTETGDINQDQNYITWRFRIKPSFMGMMDIAETISRLIIEIDGQVYTLSQEERDEITTAVYREDTISEVSETLIDQDIQGRYRVLNQYTSIQQEFPAIYELAEKRLNGELPPEQVAHIKQFKGFLMLFDQVLTDQFSQLNHIKTLMSLPQQCAFTQVEKVLNKMLASEMITARDEKHFWQGVCQLPKTEISQPIMDVTGTDVLLEDRFNQYDQSGFQKDLEPVFSNGHLTRLNNLYDHLLKRYSETTLDASLLKYRAVFSHYANTLTVPEGIHLDTSILDKLVLLKQITDKANILSEYPLLSQQRCGGFNYLCNPSQQRTLAGLSQRFMRYMGFSHPGTLPLATKNQESFYMLESDLLLNGIESEPLIDRHTLYFVVPAWPSRLNNEAFRKFLEQQLGYFIPAHLKVSVLYVHRAQLSLFERIYYAWLNALSQKPLGIHGLSGDTLPWQTTMDQQNAERIEHVAYKLQRYLTHPNHLLEDCINDSFSDLKDLLNTINIYLDESHHNQVIGDSLSDIDSSLNQLLESDTERYGGMTSTDVLFDIAHDELIRMLSPAAISHATIGSDFLVGYDPLDYLRASYPLVNGKINPGDKSQPEFTVQISQPNNL